MEARIMMGITPRIRETMLAWWPDRVPDWSEDVWDEWYRELADFTETEIEKALRYYMRNVPTSFPPMWGHIYQIAKPWRRARMDRIAEWRWQESLKRERGES
jgi:hypothetical protein